MLWYKSCPRCGDGDLSSRVDFYGEMVLCLQCGHHLSDAEQMLIGVVVPELELSGIRGRTRRRSAVKAG
jgi:hypothetical protein